MQVLEYNIVHVTDTIKPSVLNALENIEKVNIDECSSIFRRIGSNK